MIEEKKDLILREAYCLFSKNGTVATCMEEIAKNLHISKKTIYSIFKTKDELIRATCAWKMNVISEGVNKVVALDIPVVEKMVKYLEVMFESLLDVTFKIAEDIVSQKNQLADTMNNYLKNAVFGRFIKLFNQAQAEGKLDDQLDPGTALMKYWDMLSTVLVTQPSDKIPLVILGSSSVADLVARHIIEAYRSLLNETGLKEFNHLLEQHPRLSTFS